MKFQNGGGGKRKSPGKVASMYFKIVHNYLYRQGRLFKIASCRFYLPTELPSEALSLIIGFETMYLI